jgi:hypothetical protein
MKPPSQAHNTIIAWYNLMFLRSTCHHQVAHPHRRLGENPDNTKLNTVTESDIEITLTGTPHKLPTVHFFKKVPGLLLG